MQINSRLKFLVLAFGFIGLTGCPTIAPYNQKSYELTTSTKAEALAVLDKASDPYNTHIKEVEKLRLEVEKAYEYANGIPKNEVVVGMWNEIRGYVYRVDKKQWVANDNGNLYSTLELWKRKKILNASAVDEKKKQIASSFDQIIGLEGGKNKK
jgi:hypothetical protein